MSATQTTLTCPYCSCSKLKGQTGLSVHIAKSQPCKEAQEKMALVQLHVPTESATSVLVLHDCLVSYISDCFINPGQLTVLDFHWIKIWEASPAGWILTKPQSLMLQPHGMMEH